MRFLSSQFFRLLALGLTMLAFFSGCDERSVKAHHPTISFYFWKTRFSLTEEKKAVLDSVSSGPLFTRFFDVVFDDSRRKILPVAIIDAGQVIDRKVVPVIFIKKQVFEHISADDSLEAKVMNLVGSIAKKYRISLSDEIQIDCDWTEKTRDNYFSFLKRLRALSEKKVSCTIRLHQVKYSKITGIPPVDRGVLMFYNMGSLKQPEKDYIFNKDAAELYVSSLSSYPLELDLALPYYSHILHCRESRVINILPSTSEEKVLGKLKSEGSYYSSDSSFFCEGLYIQKGDQLKIEKAGIDVCMKAAAVCSDHLKGKVNNLLLYEINSASEADIEEILSLPSYFN